MYYNIITEKVSDGLHLQILILHKTEAHEIPHRGIDR